jgi:tape measure domain-containing protein
MAANSIAKLAVLITGDASPLRTAMNQGAQAIDSFAKSAQATGGAGGGLGGLLGLATKFPGWTAAIAAGAAALTAFAKSGVAAAANMEQLRISLEVMTGSAEKARDLISDMQKLSLETPLEMTDIQQAGKTLMAMGEPTQAIISDLKMLGDIAAGTGQPLNELAQVFGQVMQAGRLTGNELRQFNERGVPLLTVLSEQLGVSKGKIRELVEAGEISSTQVVAAFEAMSGAGGKFANMMERQTDTLIGQWNKFKENITLIAMNAMAPLAEALKEILKMINDALDGLMQLMGVNRSSGGFKTVDDAATKAMRERETAQKNAEKAANEAKKAAEEAAKIEQKHTDEIRKRGEELTRSLRTPIEIARDRFAELNELFHAGVISAETMKRAMKDIDDGFAKASKVLDQTKEQSRMVGANERYTQAGYSAAQQGAERSRNIEANTKRTADNLATNNQLLRNVDSGIHQLVNGGGTIRIAGL